MKETYGAIDEEMATVRFSPEWIEIRDSASETKLRYHRVKTIVETGQYFFIQFVTFNGLILPKKELQDLAAMRQYLRDLGKSKDIDYLEQLNWKWK